jgi:hypothetical protein
MNDVQKLAFDAANGIARDGYTKEQINDAVRNAVNEACGGAWNYYNFMENRYKVFKIMAEIMPVAMQANLSARFESFAQFHDTATGDKPYFFVEDNETYPVVTVARGNMDVERNRIIDRNFTVATQSKAIKFYEEFDMFMTGKMDMARLTEKASTAMTNYVGELIATTIYGSYSAVGANYKTTGAFDAATFNTMIEHVKAATGAEKLQIFGTTTSLANVSDGFGYSDGSKDRANGLGYWGEFRGNSMVALPQAYTAGSVGTFHVSSNYLLLLPANEKIVKVLFEGEALVDMKDGMNRNDMQPEILFSRRVGAAAITVPAGKFGLWFFQ